MLAQVAPVSGVSGGKGGRWKPKKERALLLPPPPSPFLNLLSPSPLRRPDTPAIAQSDVKGQEREAFVSRVSLSFLSCQSSAVIIKPRSYLHQESIISHLNCISKFCFRYLQDGTVLKKYAHCFAILMRLRQLCLHPSLCAKDSESLQHAQNLLQGNCYSISWQ